MVAAKRRAVTRPDCSHQTGLVVGFQDHHIITRSKTVLDEDIDSLILSVLDQYCGQIFRWEVTQTGNVLECMEGLDAENRRPFLLQYIQQYR